jgi:hypothetical protein
MDEQLRVNATMSYDSQKQQSRSAYPCNNLELLRLADDKGTRYKEWKKAEERK